MSRTKKVHLFAGDMAAAGQSGDIDDSNYVKIDRKINTTSPVLGGDNLGDDLTISLAGLANLGTANYLPGVNAAANAWEYKQLIGTANRVSVSHAAGSITWDLPQDIHTGASPTFATVKLSDLTDGYFPYHIADVTGLANGPLYRASATAIVLGGTSPMTDPLSAQFTILGAANAAMGIVTADGDSRASLYLRSEWGDMTWDLSILDQSGTGGLGVGTPYSFQIRYHNGTTWFPYFEINPIGNILLGTLTGVLIGAAGIVSAEVPLHVVRGGTGAITLTDHGVLLGSGTGAITPMAVLAAGEIIYGVAGADPAALAAGALTQILVGGGAAAPVWTLATGTGGPVRAGSPTFTGIPIAPTIALSNLTDGNVPYHVSDAAGFADSPIFVSAGKLGIGTQDIEAWAAGFGVIQLPYDAMWWGTGGTFVSFITNMYYSTDYKYRSNNPAGMLYFSGGFFSFYNAPNGTIDTTATITERFKVDGIGDCWTNDGGVHSLSDMRAKNHIRSFDSGLKEILALTPAIYKHKKELREARIGPTSDYEFVGLKAQDLMNVIPEAVKMMESGYLGMTSQPILYAAVNAIKELDARLRKLETN